MNETPFCPRRRTAPLLAAACAALASVISVAPTASAGTANASSAAGFVAPTAWTRGDANAAYALWDNSFTTVTGDNNVVYNGSNLAAANVMSQTPTLTGWNVRDTHANAVTSTQHLYGGGSATVGVDVTVPGGGLGDAYHTTFRVQLDMATTVVGADAFTISTDGGTTRTPLTATVTSLAAPGPNGAANTLYEFTVPGNAASYLLSFSSPSDVTNANNAALNALAVDTFASTPEPASAALAGVAGAASLLRRRRRAATAGV